MVGCLRLVHVSRSGATYSKNLTLQLFQYANVDSTEFLSSGILAAFDQQLLAVHSPKDGDFKRNQDV